MACYTEHTVKLPDGIKIFYTDSGAPKAVNYTTIVILHGSRISYVKQAAARTELPGYAPPMQATLKVQTQQTLFNVDLASSYFPDVNIFYISGTDTCSYCIWAYMESRRMYKDAVEREEEVRPTLFKLVPGGNHFLHYDMPEIFLEEVLNGCTAF
ncbi:hypothetical protein K438DRAFT_1957603 [Mycena galopus ATCC 62051]|nr:hypothetical protein K438DRAFT_1957603 [Mycena galopus ATCC 62051]